MNAGYEELVRPTRAEAFAFWVKLGFASFGGSAAQIALMHAELVVRRRWISETGFRHDLALCQSLPGPEAQQLATLSAMRLHGRGAGFFAGAAFVIPGSVFVMCAGIWLPGPEKLAPLWLGLRVGALALLAPSAWKMLRRNPAPAALALAAFGAATSLGGAPQPLIAALAGVAGVFLFGNDPHDARNDTPAPGFSRKNALTGLVAVTTPALLAGVALGGGHAIIHCAKVSLRVALVGFGGAYALLPEAFRLFAHFGPMAPGLMADATTVAEASPGPFLLAIQHGAFVTAKTFPGNLPPVASGLLGALLASWCLFATSTSLVLLAAPVADNWARRPKIRAALTGIGAAAAGQIAGLVVPVAIAATPDSTTDRVHAALILMAGFLFVLRVPRFSYLAIPLCGLAGWLLSA